MGGLLLIWLLLDCCILLAKLWPLWLALASAWIVWRWVAAPWMAYQAAQSRDRLRHEQARREIDRIALTSTQAMVEAARSYSDTIEGTAVEVKR